MKNSLKRVRTVVLVIVLLASTVFNTNIYFVRAADVLTSPEISVLGFQMKTNVTSGQGITFRTICKSPDKGSVIKVNGMNYTVKNFGTIYMKDPNQSGKYDKNILGKPYTELDTMPYPQSEKTLLYGFKYIGSMVYEDEIVTFGYVATDQGIIEKSDGYTSYVRSMTQMDSFATNSLLVRAFVEAEDKEGNNVIIYSEYASVTSVAEVAYKVYEAGMAPSAEGHHYLYSRILHRLPELHPFYVGTPMEYGWGGVA